MAHAKREAVQEPVSWVCRNWRLQPGEQLAVPMAKDNGVEHTLLNRAVGQNEVACRAPGPDCRGHQYFDLSLVKSLAHRLVLVT